MIGDKTYVDFTKKSFEENAKLLQNQLEQYVDDKNNNPAKSKTSEPAIR